MTATSTWTVAGMTCAHCVASVTEEVQEIEGVQQVAVDLDTGVVTVTSTAPLALDEMAAAVDAAGYLLAT